MSRLQNVTKIKSEAAALLAEDVLSDEEIASRCGVSRQTLARWKGEEAFRANLEAIQAAYAERALKHGIARRDRRLQVLNRLHDKALQVIDERAADPELADIPGGKTGLVVRNVKGIGQGKDFQVVEVYEVDTATMREIRAIHEQAAKELGQLAPRTEDGGPPVNVQLNQQINVVIRRVGD